MSHPCLSQHEANNLIKIEKRVYGRTKPIEIKPGDDVSIPMICVNFKERFILDLTRATIKISKAKYQVRARSIIVLVRLDLNGATHKNPDNVRVPCPHLHLYREGYEDQWAIPVDPTQFSDPANLLVTFGEFMRYCNVVQYPPANEGLWGHFT